MAGFINKSSDQVYISNLKAVDDFVNGMFVLPNFSAGTATTPTSSSEGDGAGLLFVHNANTHIDQELVADADFVIKKGKFLRLKALRVGDVVTTDQFAGDIVDYDKDDVVAVTTGGKIDAIGVRTPVLTLKVVDKVKLFGNDALKLIVETV